MNTATTATTTTTTTIENVLKKLSVPEQKMATIV